MSVDARGPHSIRRVGSSNRRRVVINALVVVSVVETITLAVLLINLVTAGNHHVAQAVGPVHGGLYIAGIALTFMATRDLRARLTSVIPVVGSIVALVLIRSSEADAGSTRPSARDGAHQAG